MDVKDDEDCILKDEIIQVSYKQTIEDTTIKRTQEIRRIAYYSQKHKDTFVYQTNNTTLNAMDIVAIYQNRWQIEKFFKKLKQNFPLQYFLGDNENAIHWLANTNTKIKIEKTFVNTNLVCFNRLIVTSSNICRAKSYYCIFNFSINY